MIQTFLTLNFQGKSPETLGDGNGDGDTHTHTHTREFIPYLHSNLPCLVACLISRGGFQLTADINKKNTILSPPDKHNSWEEDVVPGDVRCAVGDQTGVQEEKNMFTGGETISSRKTSRKRTMARFSWSDAH